MNVLVSVLIIAVTPAAPIEVRYAGADEVFRCQFDEPWDKNFDHWPDQWWRRKGRGFPRYVKVEISDEPTPTGNRCLRIDLDGGAVAAFSPTIPISHLYTYVLEGLLQTEGLQHDQVYLSLTLLDQQRRRLEAFHSQKIGGSQSWTKLRLGPVAPDGDNASFAVIGLHLEPGDRADLSGSVRFDDLWLGRLPRMSLSANSQHHVFTEPDQITVSLSASGMTEEDPPVVFRLEDASGALISEDRQRMKTVPSVGHGNAPPDGRATGIMPVPPAGSHRLPLDDSPVDQPTLVGSVRWKPTVPGVGFYRVRATMYDRDNLVHRRELTLAVVDEHRGCSGSEFGWSLPQGDKPLPLAELGQLVGQAGIGWVKYPLWFDEQADEEQVREVSRFSQSLAEQGIELVGLLSDPPAALRSRFRDSQSAAEIFTADPQLWFPSLESAVARMGIQVRWWQLGLDKDFGFVGCPKLAERIAEIKAQLDTLSHDANVGFGWDWRAPVPIPSVGHANAPPNGRAGGAPAWRFLALSADPPPTREEVAAYMAAARDPQLRRWVVLEPLCRDRYSSDARAIDLVRQMTAAKIDGAEGIFVTDPFSTDRGLMNDDGTAGELFMPWRTTALMLARARYLGSIQLPSGSQNHIFARQQDAVMVVSNEAAKQEVIYLGHDVRQVDLWGRSTTAGQRGNRQVIEVGHLGTFVTGIDEKIVRWRQGFSLASDWMPSVAGSRHENSFRLKNTFDQPVAGHVELIVPDRWELHPRRTDFRLARGEELQQPFEIMLPYNAASGRHPIRADFELQADRPSAADASATQNWEYRFSVYRHLDVGSGDVYIELVTRLNQHGELEVEQHFINDTQEPVSFRCHLLAPDRRRQKTQVVGLGHGRQLHVYRLPDGQQLIGKTLWLRAEQVDGPRVLNYRFVPEKKRGHY